MHGHGNLLCFTQIPLKIVLADDLGLRGAHVVVRRPFVFLVVLADDLGRRGAHVVARHSQITCLGYAPYCNVLYGVKYIGLVSLAPYGLYGVKYIGLVSLAPYVLCGVKYIGLVSLDAPRPVNLKF